MQSSHVPAVTTDHVQSCSVVHQADRPLEWFLLLNGLDRPGALKPGERFKVVAD